MRQQICKCRQLFNIASLQTQNLRTNNWLLNELCKPASKPIHTNSQKQARPFFHRTKALFLPSRFWQSTVPRASSSLGADKQSRSCVCTRTESWSIAVWKVTPTTNEPSRQRQAIRTWSWNLMVFQVICFWKTFAGLSYWSNNYNGSMQQAFMHFIQSREDMRTDHCVQKQNGGLAENFSFLPLLKQMKLSSTFWAPIKK